jgi:hypothetical protein
MSEHSTPNSTPAAPPVHVHHAQIPEEHPERHEHSDVSVRGIWITVGAVFLVTLIVHVIMYVVFFAYEGAQAKEDEAQRRSAFEDKRAEPPAGIPRLQGIDTFNAATPAEELVKLRQENRAIVNSWGATPDGRNHIPIDRAMQIALENQKQLFPSRAPATQPAGGAHAAR